LRVDVYPFAAAIPDPQDLKGRVAVVIDVLRATTTILTALTNGADTVVPVLSPEEAFQVQADNPQRKFVLGGERQSLLIPGFHLGNSPLEYTPARVGGRPVLFTTTNGTRAIRGSAGADQVLIASFLNAPAVALELLSLGLDIAICCAGTHDQFSLEDGGCAGAILDYMSGPDTPMECNDLGRTVRAIYRQFDRKVADLIYTAEHGQRLLQMGLQEDLLFCSQVGTTRSVPRYKEGQITAGG